MVGEAVLVIERLATSAFVGLMTMAEGSRPVPMVVIKGAELPAISLVTSSTPMASSSSRAR